MRGTLPIDLCRIRTQSETGFNFVRDGGRGLAGVGEQSRRKRRRLERSVLRLRPELARVASTITTGGTSMLLQHLAFCIGEPTLNSLSRRCFSAQPQRAILRPYPGVEEGAPPAL